MRRDTLGIVVLTVAWIAVSVVALMLATRVAVIVFAAVTIGSFAIGKALLERHGH